MVNDPRVRVLMGAFALGLKARLGHLVTVQEVDELRANAEALLPPADDLRSAVLLFATIHQAQRNDRAAMVEAGAALERGVERATRIIPPGLDRRDIHG